MRCVGDFEYAGILLNFAGRIGNVGLRERADFGYAGTTPGLHWRGFYFIILFCLNICYLTVFIIAFNYVACTYRKG